MGWDLIIVLACMMSGRFQAHDCIFFLNMIPMTVYRNVTPYFNKGIGGSNLSI